MVQLYQFMADEKLILKVVKTLHGAGFNQMMYDGFQVIQGLGWRIKGDHFSGIGISLAFITSVLGIS